MTDEIEVFPNGTVVLPVSGEVIDLRDADVVAKRLAEARRLKTLLAEAERLLTGALNEYAETSAQPRTVTLPGGERFVREGGPAREYDAHAVERELREAGCPPDAIARIVQRVTTVKVNGTEANKAAKANPRYAEILERNSTTVDHPWRIRL